ncbi:MAG: hypothetical protein QXO69_01180 [archaeon]
MAKKEETLVWSDSTGKYKVGYSQYLQMKTLKVNTLLLICAIILILMLAVGAWYAHSLIVRIDEMNVLSHLASMK